MDAAVRSSSASKFSSSFRGLFTCLEIGHIIIGSQACNGKRGEPRVCSMVRVPTPEDEDQRRLCRERKVLTIERVQHVNRIKGLRPHLPARLATAMSEGMCGVACISPRMGVLFSDAPNAWALPLER